MNIFHLVPVATYKLVEPLADILITAESELLIEVWRVKNVVECSGMFWNDLECFGVFWSVNES